MVPSLFLGHGSPMIAIEENSYTKFLTSLGKSIHPKAIVVFTAHWESPVTTISSTNDTYETIYDFYGFPDELFRVTYPAKGSVTVAEEVANRLEQHGIKSKFDSSRGLDHGSWTLLTHLYPDASIPVVQVSVNPFLPIEEQFKIGEALKGLGEEDILVIGSGATVHNLRILKWGQQEAEQWAVDFDDWLIDKLQNRDLEALKNYEKLAPNARVAVPTPEHFIPLIIAFGSGNSNETKVIYRSYDLGLLSYICFQF